MTITAERPTATLASGRIAADDPRHGSIAGSSAGCTCGPCRAAKSAYQAHRTRRLGYGTWRPWVDAEPVRAHLRYLSQNGMGWGQVAQRAGLADATVSGILYPRGKQRDKPSQRCRPHIAAALLAVQPTLDNLTDATVIDATGTVRRLRALVAQGHTTYALGDRLPMHREAAGRLIRHGERCTAGVARAARALYDELWDQRPQGWVHDRARRMAASRAWAPPAAWDDDTIDIAGAQPDLGSAADVVDPVLVERALDGWRATLTPAERRAAVQIGLERGLSVTSISKALHMSGTEARRIAAAITDQAA